MTDEEDENKATGNRDKSGTGKTGGTGGAAGGIRVPPTKLKAITEAWKHHSTADAVARLAEFFSELPARASAQLEVSWAILGDLSGKGFMIVTNLLKLGQQIYELKLNPTRENRERLRLEFGILIAG
jgi:hypothetical protein